MAKEGRDRAQYALDTEDRPPQDRLRIEEIGLFTEAHFEEELRPYLWFQV